MGQKEKQMAKSGSSDEGRGTASTVSREFQPGKRQQKANTMWRKQQQQETMMQSQSPQQQHIYGFVPFKSVSMSANISPNSSSIYGTNLRSSAAPSHNSLSANDYLNSIYAPPHFIRQQPNRPESALNSRSEKNRQLQGLGSRPGSDLGMYKMMPSRCQSYTTLPRPEHGVPDLVSDGPPLLPPFGVKGHLPQHSNNIAAPSQMPFRSPSVLSAARSLERKNSLATPLPPAYFGANSNVLFSSSQINFDVGGEEEGHGRESHHQEMVSWSTISLSSWLTIVFGSAIFCLSAVRLYWRADITKGSQELFYGVSAICAGIVGVLASQHRSYCMLIAAFLHFATNAIFFVPFISGILPLIPLINSATNSFANSAKPMQLLNSGGGPNGNKELPVVDTGLVMLSLLQLAAAFSLLLYGCRAFGRTMHHVEGVQRRAMGSAVGGEGGSGGGESGRSGQGMAGGGKAVGEGNM